MSADDGLWDLVDHDTGKVLEGPLDSPTAGKRRRELEALSEGLSDLNIWIERHVSLDRYFPEIETLADYFAGLDGATDLHCEVCGSSVAVVNHAGLAEPYLELLHRHAHWHENLSR